MIGEGRFIAFASHQGWHLYRGVSGHTPCDFVLEGEDGRLIRVEVKRIESVQVDERGRRYVTATKMKRKNFDYLFVSTPHGDYWIPARDCPEQTISIRAEGPGVRDKYAAYRVLP